MSLSPYVLHICDYECVWFSCVGITLLLSMTVFQLIIADKVPESSQAVPIVGMIRWQYWLLSRNKFIWLV